jgi:hypothetical protein
MVLIDRQSLAIRRVRGPEEDAWRRACLKGNDEQVVFVLSPLQGEPAINISLKVTEAKIKGRNVYTFNGHVIPPSGNPISVEGTYDTNSRAGWIYSTQ